MQASRRRAHSACSYGVSCGLLLITLGTFGACGKGPTNPSNPSPPVHPFPGMDIAYDISPDGDSLVYRHRQSAEGVRGVYLLDLADTALVPTLLMPDSALYLATNCRFSRDGRKLAYLRNFTDIYVMDLVTNDHRQVTFTSGNVGQPEWDPSGRYIVYERIYIPFGTSPDTAGLHIVDTETLDDQTLRHGASPTFGSNPRWSPDGTRIVCELSTPFDGVQGGSTRHHVFVLNLQTGTYTDITPNDRRNNEFPIWLNDSRILFESYSEQTFNVYETQTTDAGGGGRTAWPVELRPYGGFMAAAPQQSFFVYTGPDSSGDYGVLYRRGMLDATGQTVRQLTKFTPISTVAQSDPTPLEAIGRR